MKQEISYIDQINAFERWLETSYLSTGSQLLWYKLLVLFNRSWWNEWVTVDNRRLMSLMQVNREATFLEWRNSLIDAGLLQYKKGKKGSPNQYKMIFFTCKNEVNTVVQTDCTFKNEVQTVVQPVVQSEVNTVVQTVDILRQDKDIDKDDALPASHAIDFVNQLMAYMAMKKVGRTNRQTPAILENYLRQGMEPDLIRYAIDKASKANAPWKYADVILEDEFQHGFLTVSAIQERERKRDEERANTQISKKTGEAPDKKTSYDLEEFERTKFFVPTIGEEGGKES